jgi:hypothetical protein
LLASNDGDERDVQDSEVLVADSELELTHGLDERSRLDVSNGSSELQDTSFELSEAYLKQEEESRRGRTSMMQTSGSSSVSSTGRRETRSIQS